MRGRPEELMSHGYFYWQNRGLPSWCLVGKPFPSIDELLTLLPIAFQEPQNRERLESAMKDSWTEIRKIMLEGGVLSRGAIPVSGIGTLSRRDFSDLRRTLKDNPILCVTLGGLKDEFGLDLNRPPYDLGVAGGSLGVVVDARLHRRLMIGDGHDVLIKSGSLKKLGPPRRSPIVTYLETNLAKVVANKYQERGVKDKVSPRVVVQALFRDVLSPKRVKLPYPS